MNKDFKRDLIINHYQEPFHKVKSLDENLITFRANNPSCIDDLTFGFKVENEVILDAYFSGEACAISTSAASMMLKMVIGKTYQEIKQLIVNYENMINEESYDQEILNELNAYDEIYLQPNRKTCALLPFWALKELLKAGDN